MKSRIFWDVLPCSQVDVDRRFRRVIALIIETVRTSETSVNIYLLHCSNLHPRRLYVSNKGHFSTAVNCVECLYLTVEFPQIARCTRNTHASVP
jgi:hypothetical protein